jgi:hypothetical protein
MTDCLSKPPFCKRLFQRPRDLNHLRQPTSRTARTLALASAACLVIASAGFGSVYAWSTGSQHGIALGGLSVLMAVALEASKPLALAGSLGAFGSLNLVRGLALILLAAVAVLYSLTSELTLMAGARGDVVAGREAALKASVNAEAEAQRARTRYETAKTELATLTTTRPAGELQTAIDQLLATPGADGCTEINGKVTRTVYPQVAALRTELVQARQRAELQAIIAEPLPIVPLSQEIGAADPGATALSVYLAALRIRINSAILSEWLALIPIVALQIGSATAALSAGAYGPTHSSDNRTLDTATGQPESPPAPVPQVSSRGKSKRRRNRGDDDTGHSGTAATGHRVMPANVVDLLRERGGKLEAGQRAIGKLLGVSKSRANQIIHELAAAGAVLLDTSRAGTRLALAG